MPFQKCSFKEMTHIRVKGRIHFVRHKSKNINGTNDVVLGDTTRIVLTEYKMKENQIEFLFYTAPPPGPIWNDIEKEIILADIAYLKQKEIESGNWAKWEADQAQWKSYNAIRELSHSDPDYGRVSNDIVRITVRVRHDPPDVLAGRLPNGVYVAIPRQRPVTGNVTPSIWHLCIGREAQNDDIERANCLDEGQPGHRGCGWCSACLKPRWMCNHGYFQGEDQARIQVPWPPHWMENG
jgi:hypothetical protein